MTHRLPKVMWDIIQILCFLSTLFPQGNAAKLTPLELPDFKISQRDCILAAVKKYINAEATISVASSIKDYPENVTSVIPLNHMIFKLLTDEARWTILTKNMVQYSKPTFLRTMEKLSRCYIIFVRDLGEISANLKRLRTFSSWNPHSNFFVVSATIFPYPSDVASEILRSLWEERILNGVVFLANPENTSLYDVYTSKPYVQRNCGKDIGQMEVVDTCIAGIFQRKRHLFKHKIPKRLTNCTLSVGYSKIEPAAVVIENNSIPSKDYYHTDHGIEINLVNMIGNLLDLKVIYYQATSGRIFFNGTASGNLLLLKEDKIDVAIGFYYKTFERNYFFDCSDIYIQDRLVWCVPHIPVLLSSHNFLNILDLTSWALLIILYLITVNLFWIVVRINRKELRPYHDYKNVSQYIFSILLGFPVPFHPRTFQIRIMFIFIVVFSFHLDSAYLSSLTSVLTGSRFGEKYSTTKDIYKNNLKTYFVPNSARFFRDEKVKYIVDKMIECENYRTCMDYVAFRRDSAFCVQKMYADYIYNSYVARNNEPLIYCFGNIASMPTNMLMRKGFPLFSRIDGLINRIMSGGFFVKWTNDLIRAKVGNFVSDIDIGENMSQFLHLKNLKPMFIALLVGHCFSFLVFIIELKCGRK